MNALSIEQQWQTFIEKELPTRFNERWKYTDLSFLANKKFMVSQKQEEGHLQASISKYRLQHGDSILIVLVNGYFMPTLSDMHSLPEKVIACRLPEALVSHKALVETYLFTAVDSKAHPFASINYKMYADGLFLYVPEACEINKPIHLLSIATGEAEFVANVHHLVVLGPHSKLTLVEEHTAFSAQAYMMNMVTTVVAENNAKLEHIKIQTENSQAIHMATMFIQQKQQSSVEFTNFSLGAAFARDDLNVKLVEKGAECKTAGFYHVHQPHQYIDHHIDLMHLAPHSHSEMLYKGILDKKSRAVFNGRLYVEKEAQKILAYQANHNVLLSNDAEVYSKPELEIYADDVKCKHGATTGQLDQDALFYMRARGIEEAQAKNILLLGFVEEILQRVSHAGIKQRVQESIL